MLNRIRRAVATTTLFMGAGAAAFALLMASANAQAPAPTGSAAPVPKPVLVPPHLISDPSVDYPPGATGDAVVILALVIKADGSVDAATALDGTEPFTTVSIAAALTWRFDPATRDGVAIPAKIKFKLTFAPPKPAPPPEPTETPTTSSTSPPSPADTAKPPTPSTLPPKKTEVIELVVEAEKLAPGVTSFSKAEVRELPGAFGDPFRAIEALPGVTPIVSGLPFFYVRGSPPGNVGYFLDGVRVPYLFHVGLGPSVIHPGMVEHVDLYSGGYPARYGRFAGGIVSGETTEPRHDLHGEANVRLFDLGALAETGFAGGKGSALLGFRYSYTATILSLIVKDVTLDYRDYQARFTYDLTPKDRVTLFAFGAYDLLGQKTNGTLNVLFGSEFYRADVRYEHTFAPGSTLRAAITLGFDQTRIADQRNAIDKMLGTRMELRHTFSKKVLLRSGFDATTDTLHATPPMYADLDNPDTVKFANLFPARTDLAGGIWMDVVLTPDSVMEVTPGVRVDFFKSAGATATAIDPRLSMRIKVSDGLKIIHAYGLAHQAPSFIVPVPGLVPGSLSAGLQTSFQTSAGFEAALPEAVTATATVFHNAFFKMTDALGSSTAGLDNPLGDQRSDGRAIGFELFVRKKLSKKFGGFFSYTLSRSTRTIDGRTFAATFDRTHVASAAIAYELGRDWRAGTRIVFYTGSPKVNSAHGLITPPPTLSPDRDPAFYRLDLRLEKRWNYGDKAWLAFVVEMLNATLHKETVQGTPIGPVAIPSIGLEGAL